VVLLITGIRVLFSSRSFFYSAAAFYGNHYLVQPDYFNGIPWFKLKCMLAVKKWAFQVRKSLDNPYQVFVYSAAFFVATMALNGTPIRLWGLHRDTDRLNSEMTQNLSKITRLKQLIAQAREPAFIEREALDRLDLVEENDLLFVFPTQ